MPLYLTTVSEGISTPKQRAEIADCITTVHVDVTGAPVHFVNAFFSETSHLQTGFQPLPEGKRVLVNGNIRSGRSEAAQREMIDRITQGVVDAVGCHRDEVTVTLFSGLAAHNMEDGKILPEPGSPEEAAWKESEAPDRS